MGLHAYCVANSTSDRASTDVRGIDDARVCTITENGLSMWCSEHAAPPAASVDAIRQHNAVVVAAMTDTHSPVPLRFGQWLRDDAEVTAALKTSHEKWAALVHRFEGAVEFGVRVFDPSRDDRTDATTDPTTDAPTDRQKAAPGSAHGTPLRDAPPAGTGRAYMNALAARLRGPAAERAEVVAALRDALQGVVLDERTEPLNTAHGVVSVAYLLHRARAEAFREAVDAVRVASPRLRLLSTGPWPPYSFVE